MDDKLAKLRDYLKNYHGIYTDEPVDSVIDLIDDLNRQIDSLKSGPKKKNYNDFYCSMEPVEIIKKNLKLKGFYG